MAGKNPIVNYSGKLDELHATDSLNELIAMKAPNGFTNLYNDSTLSFVNGTRTFTITPTGSTFQIYINGAVYNKTAESIVIANTEGSHFIYYNSSAVLSELVNPTAAQIYTLVRDNVFVSYIYWDATNSAEILLAKEQHGTQMDGQTHVYEHLYKRTQWNSGLALNTISPDGTGNNATDAQFGVDAGIIQDEDLQHSLSSIGATAGLPIYYNSGSGRYLRRVITTNFSVYPTGSGRLAWNNVNAGGAGIWGLTEVTNNNYVLYHIFATNAQDNPVISIMGQADYATLANARAGAYTELDALILSFPAPEFKPIATIIFQTSTGYGNTVKARIRTTDVGTNYIDWRSIGTTPGVAISTTLPNSLPSGDIFVGNASNIATAVAMSGDITISNTGVTTISPTSQPTVAQLTDSALTGSGDRPVGADSTGKLKIITSGAGDVIGPATNTDNYIPQWNGANSKTLKDGLAFSTSTTLVENSDSTIASQKAVKSYVDNKSIANAQNILLETIGSDITLTGNEISLDTIVIKTTQTVIVPTTYTWRIVESKGGTINGIVDPSFTPSFIGQIYNNTVLKKTFIAMGISSSSDWILVGADFKMGSLLLGGIGAITLTANTLYANKHLCFKSGYCNKINVVKGSGTSGAKIVAGIYSDSSVAPGTLLAQSNELIVVNNGTNYEWLQLTLQTPLFVTEGTNYWIAFNQNTNFDSQKDITAQSSCAVYKASVTYSSVLPSSFGAATGATDHNLSNVF